MMGTALSRWTMAYFTAALFFLLAAEAMMAAGYGFPAAPVQAPQTLVLVHTVSIGWLSLLVCGALLQFVPVLVARPLRGERLVLPALLFLIGGLACLLAGFLQLAGTLQTELPLLHLAAVLLPVGFAAIAVIIGMTLNGVRPERLSLPARFVAAGLASLVITFVLGGLFALELSGAIGLDFITDGLSVHMAAGVGGWLTLTAIGVSYRLLPMFMLAPDTERATGRAAWWCGVAALLLVLAAPFEPLGLARPLALALTIAMLMLYGADVVFLYRHRKRRRPELNISAAAGAFLALLASMAFALLLAARGSFGQYAGALLYLAAFGWLGGLGLSQLYKIVPFLTWLECYGSIMGKTPTPRVQDLVVERRGRIWFVLYFASVLIGFLALLAGMTGLFRLAAALTLAATLALVAELVTARRLLNLEPQRRLPAGATRPRLFLPSAH